MCRQVIGLWGSCNRAGGSLRRRRRLRQACGWTRMDSDGLGWLKNVSKRVVGGSCWCGWVIELWGGVVADQVSVHGVVGGFGRPAGGLGWIRVVQEVVEECYRLAQQLMWLVTAREQMRDGECKTVNAR